VLTYTLDLEGGATPRSWLQHDWLVDGDYTANPTATATYGIYRGDDRFYYWREER